MGSEITSLISRINALQPNQTRTFQGNRLAINTPAPAATASVRDASDIASERAIHTVSSAALSLTNRETLTESQFNTVTSLIKLANEIKNETSADRAATLSSEAQAQVTATNSAYTDAAERDPSLAEATTFYAPINRQIDGGNSGHNFTTTLAAVSSLADVGVSSTLALDASSIDDTITSLESAQGTLQHRLDLYASSRATLTQVVQTQRSIAAQSDGSISDIADAQALAESFQKRLQSSTDGVFAHRIRDLNAPVLSAADIITPRRSEK